MSRLLSADEQAQLLALANQGLGPGEIARLMDKPKSSLLTAYRRYAREGRIPRRERQPWRPWTGADLDELKRQIDMGYSYDRIARSMQRTKTAIMLKAKRIGQRLTHSNATLSAGDVAQVLGKGCGKSVSRLIRMKWLKATNAGQKQRPLWRIRWEDLLAFMENPDYWMVWSPERVTGDAAFREWARELRANEDRWLTQTEVARRYHVDRDTVKQWVAKGLLPARRYGNHYIRESSLRRFVAPCMSPRGWPHDGWIEVGRLPTGTIIRRRAA